MFYYGSVIEPILYLNFLDIADNPMIHDWCRDQETMLANLEKPLRRQAFLVDDTISAADLLVSSPFQWFPDLIPEDGPVRQWIDRCEAAQDASFIEAFEVRALKKLGLFEDE